MLYLPGSYFTFVYIIPFPTGNHLLGVSFLMIIIMKFCSGSFLYLLLIEYWRAWEFPLNPIWLRFSGDFCLVFFLSVRSQRLSLKQWPLLTSPTFLHDLRWELCFPVKMVPNSTRIYCKPIPGKLPDLISHTLWLQPQRQCHEEDAGLMERGAERLVRWWPLSISKREVVQ